MPVCCDSHNHHAKIHLGRFMKKNNKQSTKKIKNLGFTLVEMVIVAPIVILVIVIFVGAIVNMTGEIMSDSGSSALTDDIQVALNKIQSDVSSSDGFLSKNNITLTSPQGYNNDTTDFSNVGSNGTILILNSHATSSSQSDLNQTVINLQNQPNACDSSRVNENSPLMMNIVYFVKDNTLWRRVIMKSDYLTVGCSSPYEQPSCQPGMSGTMCKKQDERLVDNIQSDGFNISYYLSSDQSTTNTTGSDSSQTDSVRQSALLSSNTIKVSLTSKTKIAGKDVTKTSTIMATNKNNNVLATQKSYTVRALVIGGGGGGGSNGGGGGGGGGYQYNDSFSISRGSYQVVVGSGGAAYYSGNNSSFSTIIALGGGAGTTRDYGGPGKNGGSGGGGAGSSGASTNIAGTGLQGYNGGAGTAPDLGTSAAGGGGGGCGGSGGAGASQLAGNGGIGKYNSITGTSVGYCGGGAGGIAVNGTRGTASYGGGANTVGTANTGGGGSGGTAATGYAGGSGVVIISFVTGSMTVNAITASGTSITPTTSSGYTIYKFTTNGIFTVY